MRFKKLLYYQLNILEIVNIYYHINITFQFGVKIFITPTIPLYLFKLIKFHTADEKSTNREEADRRHRREGQEGV